MSENKVRNGTPNFSGDSLCVSCRAAQWRQGVGFRDEAVFCLRFNVPQRITAPVTMCSTYDDKRVPSIYDMEQIAWQLLTDLKGRKIGFLSPQEMRERNPQPDHPPSRG